MEKEEEILGKKETEITQEMAVHRQFLNLVTQAKSDFRLTYKNITAKLERPR